MKTLPHFTRIFLSEAPMSTYIAADIRDKHQPFLKKQLAGKRNILIGNI